jgi:hypothetical protein
MSGQQAISSRSIRGTIRRRLLVNAVVDPDEATRRLPVGLRPHVTALGTVVGCCLLEIDGIRPAYVPAIAGRTLRAAAHRISVEWEDDSGQMTVGVYVPMRQTDSRMAVALGGRWFPGVHEPAEVEVSASDGDLRWATDPRGPDGYRVRVDASIPRDTDASIACEPVAGTCMSADVGLSPDHHGVLEGARMEPDHRRVRKVAIDDLDSAFLSSFTTARVAPSYLMADVGVTWTRASAPTFTNTEVPA